MVVPAFQNKRLFYAVLAAAFLLLLLGSLWCRFRVRSIAELLPNGGNDITGCQVVLLSTRECGDAECTPEQLDALREQFSSMKVRWGSSNDVVFQPSDKDAYMILPWGDSGSYTLILTDQGVFTYKDQVYRVTTDTGLLELLRSWLWDRQPCPHAP